MLTTNAKEPKTSPLTRFISKLACIYYLERTLFPSTSASGIAFVRQFASASASSCRRAPTFVIKTNLAQAASKKNKLKGLQLLHEGCSKYN